VRTTAKADYAVRAAVELAALSGQGRVKADQIARRSDPAELPRNILAELRRAGIVDSRRGARAATCCEAAGDVTLADVHPRGRGPLANRAQACHLTRSVTRAPRSGLPTSGSPLRSRAWRAVSGQVTLADVAQGELPPHRSRRAHQAATPAAR